MENEKITENEYCFSDSKETTYTAKDLFELAEVSYPHGSPWSTETFKKDLQQPYVQYEVVYLGTKLLGFIGYRQLFDEVELTNIALHPDVKGCGLSQLFLVQWIEKLKEARVVHLEVRKSNQVAIHVYKKIGFKLINIRQDYYDYPVEDAVIMNLEMKKE